MKGYIYFFNFLREITAKLIKFTVKITFLFEVAATFLVERERVEKHFQRSEMVRH